jgi:hypothetical protein
VNRHTSLSFGRQKRNILWRRGDKTFRNVLFFFFFILEAKKSRGNRNVNPVNNKSKFNAFAKVRLRKQRCCKSLTFKREIITKSEVNHFSDLHRFCGHEVKRSFRQFYTIRARLMKFRIRTLKWNNECILNISFEPH